MSDSATEPHAVALEPSVEITQSEVSPAVQTSEPSYTRLKPAQMQLIIQLATTGRTQKEIGDIVGCSDATVSRFLAGVGDPYTVVQKVMKGDSLQALIDWKRARRVASKRGDHRPSREWIEAAHPELRPQQGEGAGRVGVTINIGQPDAPISVPVTIETRAIESESE